MHIVGEGGSPELADRRVSGGRNQETALDDPASRRASALNASAFDETGTEDYVEGAPHLKHIQLRRLFDRLVSHVFDTARGHTRNPLVLDLGAGDGSATSAFLRLGANVVAVDVSSYQLDVLKGRCAGFGDRLRLECQTVDAALEREGSTFDIVVANSFLHHVPDYLGLIKKAAAVLRPQGQFFSFQDPLRYDSLGTFTWLFSKVAYASWRMFRGDVIGGIRRSLRRSRGVFSETSEFDNTEYHVTRNGVDQDAIHRLFDDLGFHCKIECYFSTQSRLFQPVGSTLGLKNTFSVTARKVT